MPKISEKQKISHLVMMGDSLSDRGTLNQRKLLGLVPMAWITGLHKDSPLGRFTNGLTWSDDLSATLANKFIFDSLKEKYGMTSPEIADAILVGDKRVIETIQNSYHLSDDKGVKFNGLDFVRNYCEGGLCAHSYRGVPSNSPSRFFSRLILSSLDEMRGKLLSDDKARRITNKQKAQTLVTEWDGLNDLTTVNRHPSKAEADRAIKDRIKNAEQMIQHGYRHFVLINIPDLSLTPRYKAKSAAEQKNAHDVTNYFNQELAKAAKKLNDQYPEASIKIFDVNSIFDEVYNNPEKFGFDKAKLRTPYLGSKDFKLKPNKTSPSSGYLYWDQSGHPTADTHALLSRRFYEQFSPAYEFTAPKQEITLSQSAPNLTTRAAMAA